MFSDCITREGNRNARFWAPLGPTESKTLGISSTSPAGGSDDPQV